jgi:hypothetical protein
MLETPVRNVKPNPGGPLQAARAAALLGYVRRRQRIVLDWQGRRELHYICGLTPSSAERVIEDLVDTGQITIRPFGGAVVLDPVGGAHE